MWGHPKRCISKTFAPNPSTSFQGSDTVASRNSVGVLSGELWWNGFLFSYVFYFRSFAILVLIFQSSQLCGTETWPWYLFNLFFSEVRDDPSPFHNPWMMSSSAAEIGIWIFQIRQAYYTSIILQQHEWSPKTIGFVKAEQSSGIKHVDHLQRWGTSDCLKHKGLSETVWSTGFLKGNKNQVFLLDVARMKKLTHSKSSGTGSLMLEFVGPSQQNAFSHHSRIETSLEQRSFRPHGNPWFWKTNLRYMGF